MPRKKTTEASQSVSATEPVEKKIGLFDVLEMIQGKRTPWNELSDEFKAAYAPYMVNRFVSSIEFLCPLISEISALKCLTPEQHYYILTHAIPTGRKLWFNYKAFKKEKQDKDEEFLIWAVSKEYEIGKREAKTYIELLTDDEKAQLKKKWEEPYQYYK